MTYSRYLGLNMGRRMADSLSGWVHASLGKGCLILGHRFLSQRVLVPSVLLLSASGLCFCLVLLVLTIACFYSVCLYPVLAPNVHQLFTFTA